MAVQILSHFEAHVQSLKGFERQKLRAQLVRHCSFLLDVDVYPRLVKC